ncbi:hypothetical protein QQP08_004173 [Theobroma cacao]|nr:hypothetical protein QQP08_004173 [Theobroma cacao]
MAKGCNPLEQSFEICEMMEKVFNRAGCFLLRDLVSSKSSNNAGISIWIAFKRFNRIVRPILVEIPSIIISDKCWHASMSIRDKNLKDKQADGMFETQIRLGKIAWRIEAHSRYPEGQANTNAHNQHS